MPARDGVAASYTHPRTCRVWLPGIPHLQSSTYRDDTNSYNFPTRKYDHYACTSKQALGTVGHVMCFVFITYTLYERKCTLCGDRALGGAAPLT